MSVNCPRCHQQATLFLKAKDHLVSGETFELMQCTPCDFLFTFPVPDDIGSYYDSSAYLSHHSQQQNLITFLYKTVRQIQLSRKIRLLEGLTPGRRLLDYGCGTGAFLSAARSHGFNCTGIEPDPDARIIAESTSRALVYPALDDIETSDKFDTITLWHVLEHTSSPWQLLSSLYHILSAKGILVIAVPNYYSADAKHYGAYWAGYDVPRHLFHFSHKSIHLLCNESGFKLIETKPMVFDAFYVSLLSEKYKGRNIFSYPGALIQGLRSNMKATKNGQYSSLIYVLQKDA